VTMAGFGLAAAGRTTGRSPRDPEERRLWYKSGHRPWSVLIGGHWVPMWYLGPFAGALAIPAAMRDAWEDQPEVATGSYTRRILSAFGALANFYTSQTPLASVSLALDVFQGRMDRSVESSAAFSVGQFIPASGLQRWCNQMWFDPVYRRKGDFSEALMSDYPYFSKRARPYLDPLGDPAQREPLEVKVGDLDISIPEPLQPYTVGHTEEYWERRWKNRNALLKRRHRDNREVDRLVRNAVRGEIPHREPLEWVQVCGAGRTERSRLRQRVRRKFREYGIEPPEGP